MLKSPPIPSAAFRDPPFGVACFGTILLVALLSGCAGAPRAQVAAPPPPPSFAGDWLTDFGLLRLEPSSAEAIDASAGHASGGIAAAASSVPESARISLGKLVGSYSFSGGSRIEGEQFGTRFVFRYQEPGTSGEGWFELESEGYAFSGAWREDGSPNWLPWNGRRSSEAQDTRTLGYEGLFETNWGRLRIVAQADSYTGLYGMIGQVGQLQGQLDADGRLEYRYEEPGSTGSGHFSLDPDGQKIQGEWRADGESKGKPWVGSRVQPSPSKLWLVVLEPQWESSLRAEQYSFGEMLERYFRGRVVHVEVRQRRVHDRDDLLRALFELALIAEPVALWLSGHGTEDGFALHGEPLGAEQLAAALALTPQVFLLHFASCSVMAGSYVQRLRAALPQRPMSVSGYASSVEWGSSAAFEMLYLELLLNRGMSPAAAAALLFDEIGFSDAQSSGGALEALDFRLEQW